MTLVQHCPFAGQITNRIAKQYIDSKSQVTENKRKKRAKKRPLLSGVRGVRRTREPGATLTRTGQITNRIAKQYIDS